MKLACLLILMALAGFAQADPNSLSGTAPAPLGVAPAQAPADNLLDPQSASDKAAQVERHFQEGRRLYLASDREGAMRELSQALALDAAHTGASTLFETVKSEEKELRQVRMSGAPSAAAVAEPAPNKEALSGFQKLWNYVKNSRGSSERRDKELEKRHDNLQDHVANLSLQVQAQQRSVDDVTLSQAKVDQKVRMLTMGLFASLIGLLVALIVAVRAMNLARQRRESPPIRLDTPTRGPRR